MAKKQTVEETKVVSLETMELTTPESFDYTAYYGEIQKEVVKNQTLKNEEAENIISNFSKELLDETFINESLEKREKIIQFIKMYDPNSEVINNMVEHDVDKVYAISQYLLNEYIQYVNKMNFNFDLSNEEFKFLHRILTKEIEYNGDDVFNFNELYDAFWEGAKAEFEQDKTKTVYNFKITINLILILHHLIKGYKVKGVTLDYKLFRNVLYKIAQTNKLFNAYNIVIERIKNDCQLWANALDQVITTRESEVEATEVKE